MSVRILISLRSELSSCIITMVLSFVMASPFRSVQYILGDKAILLCTVIWSTSSVSTRTVSENVKIKSSEVRSRSKLRRTGEVSSLVKFDTCKLSISVFGTTGLSFISTTSSAVNERKVSALLVARPRCLLISFRSESNSTTVSDVV